MKKASIFVFIFLLATFLTTSAFASETNATNAYVLKPANDSEKVFKKMVLVIDGDKYRVELEGEKTKDGPEGYSIKVDVNNLRYKVKKMNKEELENHLSLTGKSVTPISVTPIEESSDEQNVSPMARSTSWIQVTAITDDPVGADLVWTTHKLIWDHDGTRSYLNNRVGNCNAAHPSPFGTNWFIDRCAWTYYSLIDGGRTVASDLEADYHNFDFGDNSLRTDVGHDVYIEGYYNGQSYYNVTWTKSGEASFLLDLDVTVDSGS